MMEKHHNSKHFINNSPTEWRDGVTLPCSNKFELGDDDDVKNDSVVSLAEPS